MIAPVVGAAWLREHRDDVVSPTCAGTSTAAPAGTPTTAGTCPGAVFVDLDARPRGPATPTGGRHPLPGARRPSPRGMARARHRRRRHGRRLRRRRAASWPRRLVWMLRATGHDAALLDGGLAAWDGPLETEAVAAAARDVRRAALAGRPDRDGRRRRRPRERRDRRAHARALPRPRRPGRRRAGATCRARAACPCARTSTRTVGSCRSTSCARGSRRVGVDGRTPVVSYCGSGVNACHNLLRDERAGLGGRPAVPRVVVAVERRRAPPGRDRRRVSRSAADRPGARDAKNAPPGR